MSTAQAAEFIGGYSDVTMRLWRSQGKGPRYIRLEGRVVYSVSDLRAWLEARGVDPEQDNASAG